MFNFFDEYDYKTAVSVNPSPYSADELKWGRRFAMSWQPFRENIDVLPQYIDKARAEITKHLGYEPPVVISLRHEPFVRGIVASFEQGLLSEKEFSESVSHHARHVRNDDMQRCGWASAYVEADYHRYNTFLTQFKERARARLVKNLDFEPPLEHSLDAELILRQQFLCEGYKEDMYTDVDCKAFTILFYRKALLESGEQVANEIDLMGI